MNDYRENYYFRHFRGVLLFSGLVLCSSFLNGQDFRRITLVHAEDDEPIVSAQIIEGSRLRTITDANGEFNFPCSTSPRKIQVVYFGESVALTVKPIDTCSVKTTLKLSLTVKLQQVEVNSTGYTASSATYHPEQLTLPPALLGQPDILRGLSLRSGISHGQEGSANIFIRGGTPDQNLITLDDAPVYNINHLGGFISIFNDDAIKSVTVHKTTPPIGVGNRLSSVIDVRLKNGSNKNWQAKFGLGIVSANAFLEGPILKDKTTLIVGARIGYFDLVNIGVNKNQEETFFDLQLADLLAKVSHRFSDRHRLFLSTYRSRDVDGFGENTSNVFVNGRTIDRQFVRLDARYGNQTFSVRDYFEFSNRCRVATAAYFTRYDNTLTRDERRYNPELISSKSERVASTLTDVGITSQIELSGLKSSYQIGLSVSGKSSTPLQVAIDSTQLQSNPSEVTSRTAVAFAAYESNLTNKISLHIGGRVSRYSSRNYQTIWPEIRARLTYQSSNAGLLSLSANTSGQDIHLISSGSLGQSTDAYFLPSAELPVQTGLQTDISYTRPLNKLIQLRFGAYYRQMNQLLFFQNFSRGAESSASIEDQIRKGGRGYALGLESEAELSFATTNVMVAYTLSRTRHQFSSLNNGTHFPFRYDRPHDLAVVLSHGLKKGYTVHMSFLYQSGIAVTTPTARILPSRHLLGYNVVTKINGTRFPAYHRLDLAIAKSWQGKNGNDNIIRLSVYNAYNRVNASFYRTNAFLTRNAAGDQIVDTSTLRVGRLGIFPSVFYSKSLNDLFK